MKKFLEFSITSRKTVKGKEFAKVEAYSDEEKKQGELLLKKIKDDGYDAIFAKYIPDANSENERISKLKIINDDGTLEDMLKNIIKTVLNVCKAGAMKSKEHLQTAITLGIMIPLCVDLKNGTILIPDGFDIDITNSDINNMLEEEWVGIEFKISPEIENLVKKDKTEKTE